jgi:hypothetical protein
VKKLVGVDEVLSTADMKEDKMPAFKSAATIYTPLQPAEGYAQSRGELRGANRAIAQDYWDALHPHSAGGAYVNMIMDEGQDRIRGRPPLATPAAV